MFIWHFRRTKTSILKMLHHPPNTTKIPSNLVPPKFLCATTVTFHNTRPSTRNQPMGVKYRVVLVILPLRDTAQPKTSSNFTRQKKKTKTSSIKQNGVDNNTSCPIQAAYIWNTEKQWKTTPKRVMDVCQTPYALPSGAQIWSTLKRPAAIVPCPSFSSNVHGLLLMLSRPSSS